MTTLTQTPNLIDPHSFILAISIAPLQVLYYSEFDAEAHRLMKGMICLNINWINESHILNF